MSKLNERTIANMDFVLEETCRICPNGGDHERRKYIAQELKRHAMQGDTTLTELRAAAHSALKEIKQRTA
jgi:transposase